MRDVLVHVRDLSRWGGVAAYATDLAAHVNGTLTCVRVEPASPPPDVTALLIDTGVATMPKPSIVQTLASWATTMGARQATWQVAEGNVPQVLARMSAWHDLIVIDRDPEAPLASVRELGAIVVASRAPVLLVPPRRREAKLDCIALAWNRSAEALAAIHAARPLLAHATKIVVLEGGVADTHADDGWNPKFDLARYLQWQGFRFEHDTIGGESAAAGEMLVQSARRYGADLLVMGAYGRSRVSEWALGGATRSVLFDASIPVLLKH